jgi:hypothetical protein
VKRLPWLALLPLVLALVGADVSPFPAPVVVVYPLTGTGGTPADVGGNVAILLSTKLAQLGGLTVKPFTPGTERAAYLTSAIQQGADYYITGYLTPVGADVSLIAQVVSTHSGSIVYSTSSIVKTYGDVLGQADVLREAILRHAGRGFPAVDQPAVVQTDTPPPSATNGVNLTRALGRHDRGQPAPSASPSGAASLPPPAPQQSVPSAGPPPPPPTPRSSSSSSRIAPASAAPSATPSATAGSPARVATHGTFVPANVGNFSVLVTLVDGDGSADQRTHAQRSLVSALHAVGMKGGGGLPVSAADGPKNAKALCGANAGAGLIFASTLTLGTGTYGPNSATLSVSAFGCDGKLIASQQDIENAAGKGGVSSAIDRLCATVAAALRKELYG